jgi:multidrug resistance efflux pump
MDYEKLAEVSQMVATWKKNVDAAKSKLGQAEADLYTAEKNFASYKRKLDELLKEESE